MGTTPSTSSYWTGSKPLTKRAWKLYRWRYVDIGSLEGILNLVTNVYTSQLLQVKSTGQTSKILEAKSGIRQGCPLSPCLFLIVHSMILHDVDKQLADSAGLLPWVFSQQKTPFYDLAYADDTALIAGTAQRTEQLLALVENTAAHSNLPLNWSKSLLFKSPSSQNHVYNQHGEMVKEAEYARYLGVILSRNGSSLKDVTERLRKARKHFGTIHHFWRNTGLPIAYTTPFLSR